MNLIINSTTNQTESNNQETQGKSYENHKTHEDYIKKEGYSNRLLPLSINFDWNVNLEKAILEKYFFSKDKNQNQIQNTKANTYIKDYLSKKHRLLIFSSSQIEKMTVEKEEIFKKIKSEKSFFKKEVKQRKPFHSSKDLKIDDNYYTNTITYEKGALCIGDARGHLRIYNTEDLYYNKFDENVNLISTSKKKPPFSVSFLKGNSKFIAYSAPYDSLVFMDVNYEKEILRSKIAYYLSCIKPYDETKLIVCTDKGGYIGIYDIRERNSFGYFIKSHSNEICNFITNGYSIISGGNDNTVREYDMRKLSTKRLISSSILSSSSFSSEQSNSSILYSHKAAVKGMASNGKILVTGGGTSDKSIKIYDIKNRKELISYKTDNQITGIEFIDNENLVVSFGYSKNNMVIYKINEGFDLEVKEELQQHQKRILNITINENHTDLYSISPDGVLNIWKLDEYQKKNSVEGLDIDEGRGLIIK